MDSRISMLFLEYATCLLNILRAKKECVSLLEIKKSYNFGLLIPTNGNKNIFQKM